MVSQIHLINILERFKQTSNKIIRQLQEKTIEIEKHRRNCNVFKIVGKSISGFGTLMVTEGIFGILETGGLSLVWTIGSLSLTATGAMTDISTDLIDAKKSKGFMKIIESLANEYNNSANEVELAYLEILKINNEDNQNEDIAGAKTVSTEMIYAVADITAKAVVADKVVEITTEIATEIAAEIAAKITAKIAAKITAKIATAKLEEIKAPMETALAVAKLGSAASKKAPMETALAMVKLAATASKKTVVKTVIKAAIKAAKKAAAKLAKKGVGKSIVKAAAKVATIEVAKEITTVAIKAAFAKTVGSFFRFGIVAIDVNFTIRDCTREHPSFNVINDLINKINDGLQRANEISYFINQNRE